MFSLFIFSCKISKQRIFSVNVSRNIANFEGSKIIISSRKQCSQTWTNNMKMLFYERLFLKTSFYFFFSSAWPACSCWHIGGWSPGWLLDNSCLGVVNCPIHASHISWLMIGREKSVSTHSSVNIFHQGYGRTKIAWYFNFAFVCFKISVSPHDLFICCGNSLNYSYFNFSKPSFCSIYLLKILLLFF